MQIDVTARIEDGARIGRGARIGPFCFVGAEVTIGEDCDLIANVHVSGHTTIGDRTVVHPFACLGGPPQSIAYKGEPTTLSIGSDCTIRESVTISRGTVQGGGKTVVGDHGFFMAYCHIAHDCIIGREAIFANCATLAGHCVLGDNVFMSGLVAVHQFTHIGSGAMVSGGAGLRGDVIPFGLAAGAQARIVGVNVVGMRRRKYSVAEVGGVRAAYRKLFLASGSFSERMEETASELGHIKPVAEILEFVRSPRKRPLCQARGPRARDDDAAEI